MSFNFPFSTSLPLFMPQVSGISSHNFGWLGMFLTQSMIIWLHYALAIIQGLLEILSWQTSASIPVHILSTIVPGAPPGSGDSRLALCRIILIPWIIWGWSRTPSLTDVCYRWRRYVLQSLFRCVQHGICIAEISRWWRTRKAITTADCITVVISLSPLHR